MNSDFLTAEHNVIGSILIDPEPTLPIAQGILKPDDFMMDINQEVYKTILGMNAEGVAIDPVTLRIRLEPSLGDLSEYILGCMDITLTAANIEVYAQAVKSAAMLRAIQEAALTIQEQAGDAADFREVLGQAVDTFSRLQESGTGNALVSGEEAVLEFIEYRNEFEENPEAMFVKTGFDNLDDLLGGGLVNSGLYIIAARPGTGKTTLAINIADNMVERGNPVLFVSLEMSVKQITAKRLASKCGIPYRVLLLREMGEQEYDKMAEASRKMAYLPMKVNRKPGASVRQIESMARSVKGIRCIIVDYLGLVRPDRRGKSRYEETTEISGQLKGMAIRLGIPVLCLAQLSRETEKEKGKRPRVYHLRDSGAIEQDADGIMLLHREQGDPDTKEWEGTECICYLDKNRHGETGLTKFSFYGAVSKLVPIREKKRRFE